MMLLLAWQCGKSCCVQDATNVTDDAFTLFYGKFRTNAPRVKAFMEQLEQRVHKSPE